MKKVKIILLRVAYKMAYFGWRIIKRLWITTTHGAQVVVWKNDSFLLVKASYRKQYSFPGGYINKGEKPEQSAIRELKEETKLDLASSELSLFEQFVQTCGKTQCYDTIFEVTLDEHKDKLVLNKLIVDGAEITDAKFVSVNEAINMNLDNITINYLKKKKLISC